MKRCFPRFVLPLLCVLLGMAPSRAAGQTEAQLAAWAAIVGSPAGAYAPGLLVSAFPAADTAEDWEDRSSWSALASTWKREAVPRNYNAGGSFSRTVGPRKAVGVTASFLTPGCPHCNGETMVGVDFESLWWRWPAAASRQEFAILFDGSAGYGRWPRTDDGENMSLVARLPLVVSRRVSRASTLRAFFSPGLGWGRFSIDGSGISGTVPVVGGGIEFASEHGVGIQLSAQRIVIPDPNRDYPASIGAAIQYRR